LNNYKIVIEYDGKNFFGWQIQKNTTKTIQETIEKSFKQILNEDIKITASGRTDTAVNALNQTAHFKTDTQINPSKLIYSLNSILPPAITIKDMKSVPLNFHARYSVKKREYEYNICLNKKSVYADYYYKLNYDLDFNIIDKFIPFLIGDNSFKSLCKNKTDKHNFRCSVYDLTYKLKKTKNELLFNIIANRFLHSMVRAIIGCLIDLGRGRLQLEDTKTKFLKGEKIKTTYLPGNALFLKNIYY
jgi:tRNA pseudouridine38-40 synthase